jgi:hypothetical protein
MKRKLRVLLILLCVVLLCIGIRHLIRKQAQKKREAGYQAALRDYRQAFKQGITRKEVEDYLRMKNVPFRQLCCVELSSKHSWDDFVKIGEEDTPWICSENNVYVAFEFADHQSQYESGRQASDLDTLSAITISQRLDGCL